jgi:EF-P beta-lysylation protein EpmB
MRSKKTPMIPTSVQFVETPAWKNAYADAIKEPKVLLELLGLPSNSYPQVPLGSKSFPMRVPRSYVARMGTGNPADPLLLQVLPVNGESIEQLGFSTNPVGDAESVAVPGLLHKYLGRVLILVTGACAIHCRYCFRRHFPYSDSNPTQNNWQQALDYINSDPSISEVILSGGDPLSLDDTALAALIERLEQIPHLKRLRIHTRTAVVIPQRITQHLVKILSGTRLKSIVVIHTNHANEINDTLKQALHSMHTCGITLFNQSVLLRRINDNIEALVALSEALFEASVIPYYLHMLDRVAGASHFEVSDKEAMSLVKNLSNRLPGYMVPKLVREVAGNAAKVPL